MTWIAPLSTVLVRYRDTLSGRRLVTHGPPPFGYALERHIGALRTTAFEGTERLTRVGDEFVTTTPGDPQPVSEEREELGYLETAPLPQLQSIGLAVHRPTGQQVLVTPDDPLLAESDLVRHLGFAEPVPIEPTFEPFEPPGLGLVGLVKSVDHQNRRHRYAIGTIPPGQLVGELGGMAESAPQGTIGVWIVDGRLVTERHAPPGGRTSPLRATRWVLEPAVWRGIATSQARAKTALRRSSIAATNLVAPGAQPPQPSGDPEGWLFGEYGPGLSPLFASYHPVTGDQLLTRSLADVGQMGYEGPTLLGFLRLAAPVTGSTEQAVFAVPWARRFGAVPRIG